VRFRLGRLDRLGRGRRLTPYLEAAAGHSFAPSGRAEGGFFMNPSVGAYIALRGALKLGLSVGYEFQELSRLRSHADGHFRTEFVERLSHNSLSVRIGVIF